MVKKLREGKPSIEVSPGSVRQLGIGVWMMEPGEDAIVGERIRRSWRVHDRRCTERRRNSLRGIADGSARTRSETELATDAHG